MFSDLLST